MAGKKFFSDDDIEAARLALSELPDLTAKRKTLHDFLSAIRDDIIVLVRTKGYTLADIRSTLKEAGYEVGQKTLRDIIREAEAKKTRRRSGTSPAKIKAVSAHTDTKDNVKVSPEQ
ncbi:TPA: molybdopterin-guanine dinucleotide biosynthesis protein MobC [Escherichia coli]|nr:molybdopterin-guanine dinucleotide biosynthesis protein MobC [Escherichia coli]HAX4856323.1 molybdopterin-guanine dinucleotide biosynthesis protein MobC [Escherichia coli]HAX4916452.1 molybdopterin-guanine dinucleotide biosynthesis protein MobC [Escherichia coli]HAX4925308.1 molybdopterin-guanine dinucleotide biosynthesis protein MobC [Escherichia coli]HAX4948519.1 molybdopterin-guanine dinucleotide biosynthesis protein MobC [Escherichia coli]